MWEIGADFAASITFFSSYFSVVILWQQLGPYFHKNVKTSNMIYRTLYQLYDCRGISSNGGAPAFHAGGTRIDTQILQIFYYKRQNWDQILQAAVSLDLIALN